MQLAYRERTAKWQDGLSRSQSQRLATVPRPNTVQSFRPDPDRSKELGMSRVSSLTMLPRAAFKGGGVVDLEKTKTLPASVSPMFESDRDRPRLQLGPFADAPTQFQYNFPLRQRHKEAEKHGPLMFKPRTESQRIQEEISKRNLTADEPWIPKPAAPTFRHVHSEKFVSGAFKLTNPSGGSSLERRTRGVSHEPVESSLDRGIEWEPPSSAFGRKRVPAREVSKKRFDARRKVDPLQRSFRKSPDPALESSKIFSQSLREVGGSFSPVDTSASRHNSFMEGYRRGTVQSGMGISQVSRD